MAVQDPAAQRRIVNRLRRARGQLDALITAVETGKPCRDVVTQLSAARKALDQAGFRLVASGLAYCLGNPEEAAAEGYDVDDVQRMFTKLA